MILECICISSLIKLLIAFLILLFIHKNFVKPLLLIRYYKSQGIKHSIYSPLYGITKLYMKGSKEKKDTLAEIKKISEEDPNCKGLVYNLRNEVVLAFTGSEYRKEYFAKQYECYVKRQNSFILFSYLMGKENLLFSDGEKWKMRRKLISQVFKHENLRASPFTVLKNADNVFDEFEKGGKLNNFDAMKEFQTITGNSFIDVFFGAEIHKIKFEDKPVSFMISKLLGELGQLLYSPLNFLIGSKLSSKIKSEKKKRVLERVSAFRNVIKDFIRETLAKRSSNSTQEDKKRTLFEVLLEGVQSEKDTDMQDEDIILNEFLTLFAAGTDTTGHLLAHSLYLLSQNKDVLENVKAEISSSLPEDGSLWSYELINNKLPYLNAVLKETLRVLTPVADINIRIATKDHFIKEIHVKKGTRVTTLFTIPNESENLYQDPKKFIPERWLNGDGKKIEENNPHAFIPFSAGVRNCIGQHFSILEAKIIMARFIQRFNFEINDESLKKLEWVFRFLYEPKYPLSFKLESKNKKI